MVEGLHSFVSTHMSANAAYVDYPDVSLPPHNGSLEIHVYQGAEGTVHTKYNEATLFEQVNFSSEFRSIELSGEVLTKH